MNCFYYGEDKLTCSLAMAIAQGQTKGTLRQSTRERINLSAAHVQQIVDSSQVVYGINTGFGPLCTTLIDPIDTRKLQENILVSHAVGVGEPIAKELAKLMLILKVHALSKGYSGVQLSTVERILWLAERDIIPVVPKQGSVGASGDLAPLAHLFLPLIGQGKVFYQGEIRSTDDVYKELNMDPILLHAKEGLALINGTQFMAAHAVKAVIDMHQLFTNADLIATLMIEGLTGSIKPFLPDLHQLRPYPGSVYVASTIYNLLNGSAILASHVDCNRVQDPYSLRCIPQVHGASRNTWLHLKELIEIEINAVTDNPIIIHPMLTISGGSFHGQPIALPMDYAVLAVSEIGNIADRRVYLSLGGEIKGVPKLLMPSTGLNSGFMILQYTTAALASENKNLCFPASADSIPTSLGQEDHVSMGSISGRKLLHVIENVNKILSLELLCAAQALDFHRPLRSTPVVEELHKLIRQSIPHVEQDMPMQALIEKAMWLVQSGKLIEAARQAARRNKVEVKGIVTDIFETF